MEVAAAILGDVSLSLLTQVLLKEKCTQKTVIMKNSSDRSKIGKISSCLMSGFSKDLIQAVEKKLSIGFSVFLRELQQNITIGSFSSFPVHFTH
jgi:hypothetical protein